MLNRTQNARRWATGIVLVASVWAATLTAQKAPAISASPNPVPITGTVGKTTITWDTGSGAPAVVTVSVNSDAEKVFAEGPSGSADAPWIDAAATYEFRLYATAPRKLLASVRVAASSAAPAAPAAIATSMPAGTAPPMIGATPNPVAAGPAGTGTEIAWDTGDGSPGKVTVSVNGAEPTLFAAGAKGSAFADWIAMNQTYEFRLARDQAPNDVLASVTVTRPLAKVGESTLFRIVAVAVLLLLAVALWRFVKDPDPEPLA